MSVDGEFVFGVDLDGVVGDFYGFMRKLAAEWKGVELESLTPNVTYGLPAWGFPPDDDGEEYARMHRFGVTQRKLFEDLEPIAVPRKGCASYPQQVSGSGA